MDRDALIERLRVEAKCSPGIRGSRAELIGEVIAALSAAPDREAIARPANDDLDAHLPERLKGAKRCGIQRSAWLDGWFVGWSPRNDNENAEGPWSDWVALAHAILAADEAAILALHSTPPHA